jgi:hypothetical protein
MQNAVEKELVGIFAVWNMNGKILFAELCGKNIRATISRMN